MYVLPLIGLWGSRIQVAFLVLSRDRIWRRLLLEDMDALFLGKDPILGLHPGSSFWR